MPGKPSQAMWDWLRAEGYVTGDPITLQEGKKAWKKKYHREYQLARRKSMVKQVIEYTPAEYEEIKGYAKGLEMSLLAYIRESGLSLGRHKYFIPKGHAEKVEHLRKELAHTRYSLEHLRSHALGLSLTEQAKHLDWAVGRIVHLDQAIRQVLESPSLPSCPN